MQTRTGGFLGAKFLAVSLGALLVCAAACGGRLSTPTCCVPEMAAQSARVRWLEVQTVAGNGVSVATIHIGTQWLDGKLLDRGIWRVSDVDRPLLPPEFSHDDRELHFCALSVSNNQLWVALHPESADFGIELMLQCREDQWTCGMQRVTIAGIERIADMSARWSEAEFLVGEE